MEAVGGGRKRPSPEQKVSLGADVGQQAFEAPHLRLCERVEPCGSMTCRGWSRRGVGDHGEGGPALALHQQLQTAAFVAA